MSLTPASFADLDDAPSEEIAPLPRAEIRRLDLGEAHLSHLLRDLEEAVPEMGNVLPLGG